MVSAQDALNQTQSNLDDQHSVTIDGVHYLAPDVVMRAKLIAAHFLLPDNATILDIGCDDGSLSAALAYFCPRHNFIAIDQNKATLQRAAQKYKQVENLSFKLANADQLPFDDNSIDAVVDSRVLGDIYSQSGYREDAVRVALNEQFRVLRSEGFMVIYDFARAPDDEYMLLEFPTLQRTRSGMGHSHIPKQTKGDRDAQDLLWFSENAKPKQTKGCEGFFLEELSPKFPYTRLFRLPSKWAFEYIIRKEVQEDITKNIDREYAVFSDLDYFRELQSLGGRVLYSTPWQNPHILKTRFKGNFRLYHDDGTSAHYPTTGKVTIVQKMQNRKSLILHELRSTKNMSENLSVHTMRDDKTGELIDIVERNEPTADLIPYCVTPDNRIKVYLHFAAPKCVANTVPRVGRNIDGKRWSGHLVSPLKIPVSQLDEIRGGSKADLARMMMKQTGLKPCVVSELEKGPEGYAAPDMIAEKVQSYFIEVQHGQVPKCVAKLFEDRKGFSTVGEIRELDIEDVLRAINVGFIPNGWLEIQLHNLLHRHGESAEKWLHQMPAIKDETPPSDRILKAEDILSQIDPKADEEGKQAGLSQDDILKKWEADKDDHRFKRVKGASGKMRTVRSLFIDEGLVDGRMEGMASSDAEFAILSEETHNKAVILPLSKDWNGNVMMGFQLEELPVPSRMGHTGKMINLPSINLPKDIKSIDEAKAHIAEMFETSPDYITQMGESFFTDVDITPQRIYYFAVGANAGGGPFDLFFAPFMATHMDILTKPDFAWSFLYVWGFANLLMCGSEQMTGHSMAPRTEMKQRMHQTKAPNHSSSLTARASLSGANDSQGALNTTTSKASLTDGETSVSPSVLDKPPSYKKK